MSPRPSLSPHAALSQPSWPVRRFWRLEEAAHLLAVSKTTVRNLIECGQLEAGHVGRARDGRRLHLRITAQSLAKFQQERFGPAANADL